MGSDFVKGKVNSSSFRITFPLDYEGPWKSDYATALVVLQNIQKRWRREGREKFSTLPFAWSVMSRSNSTSAHYCRLGFVLSHVCIFANASQLSLSEGDDVQKSVYQHSYSPVFDCRILSPPSQLALQIVPPGSFPVQSARKTQFVIAMRITDTATISGLLQDVSFVFDVLLHPEVFIPVRASSPIDD